MDNPIRSGNPTLSENRWNRLARDPELRVDPALMTIEGTVNKTAFLVALVIGVSILSWWASIGADGALAPIGALLGLGGALVGFVLAIVISFKPGAAPYLSVPYALCEGAFLGVISCLFNAMYPGIALQALGGTLGVFVMMLVLYRTGLIRATPLFRKVVLTALFGIVALYLVNIVMHFAGWGGLSFLSAGDNTVWSIVASVAIVVVAALCLILDFDLVERGAAAGAPKAMEWYAAFGMIVTLVWLYVEMLKLLAKLRKR